ncbi:MAG: UDP-N-acetylmuramoyl-L-alanyl-D-glutamate--2,6-diaminopimelate ligase [Methylomonas sp.]
MKFKDLLFPILEINSQTEITGITLDSRQIKNGDLFVALNGAHQHGLEHADQAIKQGAVAIIYDPEGITKQPILDIECIAVRQLTQFLGSIAAKFYGKPSEKLAVIGITGTNGKTTCSQLIAQALPDCGVIGTLGWGAPRKLLPTANTTPDALAMQAMLSELASQNKQAVAMEVSSHGLQQGRVNAVEFTGAVFTNISRDHLDYHGNMDEYLKAKLMLFRMPSLKFSVLNLDDPKSKDVLQVLDSAVDCWTFSTQGKSLKDAQCLIAENIRHSNEGIDFEIHFGEKTFKAYTPIVGDFNLENVLAVLAVLLAMNTPLELAIAKLRNLKAIVGRMEKFGGDDKPTVLVDYAHTPDALEKVLKAVKTKQSLCVVFGCGGNRDQGKRPEMGRIAESYADRVIITDDNPRNESADEIIEQILAGCQTDKMIVINDRATAITTAICQAKKDDWIVIAGKGHEAYQEINGVKWPFSDQTIVEQALATWGQQ